MHLHYYLPSTTTYSYVDPLFRTEYGTSLSRQKTPPTMQLIKFTMGLPLETVASLFICFILYFPKNGTLSPSKVFGSLVCHSYDCDPCDVIPVIVALCN